ncbi:MMPL family transporter [Thiomicrorhabdus arctica]|uniref:MMPL family transporter n=1 Tax=Thiomicrorhabdus arctica TaxID=131540 RepID=UPI0003762B4E|nr:MMPL family transporter [Thiomicrorhabdus arctica]
MKMTNRQIIFSSLIWIFIGIIAWASLVAFFNKSPFQNDITQFFPNQQSIEAQYLKNRLTPTQKTSWLMLAVKTNQPKQTLYDISHTVQSQLLTLKGVKQVLNGAEPYQSPLQQSPTPKLYAYRYLMTSFESAQLSAHIQQRWQEYQLGFVLDKHWLLDDPTFQWALYQNKLKPIQQLVKENGVWVSPQSTKALLLIETEKQPKVLANLYKQLERSLGKNNFQLSGADWVALQAEQQIRKGVNWITSIALGMVFLALFIAFRSPKLILFSSLPLLGAFSVGILSTISLFGSMQLITLALGAILLGVAIDYPIHTISAYQSRKLSVVQQIWPTIRLGALTSAFGFLMLWWINIEGLQQMAIFASSGLLTALFITRALKPFLASHYKIDDITSSEPPAKSMINQTPSLYFVGYLLPGLVIIAAILFLKPIQWQDDIASLSPVSKGLIQTDRQLRSLFQYQEVGKQLLLPAKNIEVLLQHEEALLAELEHLKTTGAIQQFQLLAQSLPSQRLQAKRQKNLPDAKMVLTSLSHAVEATRFTTTHFQPFINSLELSRKLPLMTYVKFIETNETSARLASQLVLSLSDQMVGVIPLSGVVSDQVIEDFVQQHADLGLIYFNQRKLVAKQITEIRFGLFQILGFILLMLGISLWLKYRSVRQVIIVLSPIIMAIGLTLATLALLNISLSIFHLMSLMLVAAIGIDYSLLFFEGAQQTKNSHEWSRSIRVAFLTTLGSFSILSMSQLALLNAIGITVLIGVLWVYSLAFLLAKNPNRQ